MRKIKTTVTLLVCLMGSAYVAGAKTVTTFLHLHELLQSPNTYVGKTVTIEGAYKGWRGSCKTSGQPTRSDWLIVDDSDCVYVTGLKPHGPSPALPGDEKLRVTGKLMNTPTGKPYFQATDITVLPPEKCDCRK
jgi:hypothetical protein